MISSYICFNTWKVTAIGKGRALIKEWIIEYSILIDVAFCYYFVFIDILCDSVIKNTHKKKS